MTNLADKNSITVDEGTGSGHQTQEEWQPGVETNVPLQKIKDLLSLEKKIITMQSQYLHLSHFCT